MTPARAGTTRAGEQTARCAEDDPRSRGDDLPVHRVAVVPPRMTPARAGTTVTSRSTLTASSDDPRSRGDDSHATDPEESSCG